MKSISSADYVLSAFDSILSSTEDLEATFGKTLAIPKLDKEKLVELCQDSILMLEALPPLAKVEGPAFVIGDIHGNLFDLLRIFHECSSKTENCYVFLGDYVDRGPFSVECISIILALFIKQPQQYILIRGNHEFPSMNTNYGFKDEIVATYGDTLLWEKFNEVFSWLQIAAIIGSTYFCIHGGLAPDFENVQQINEIKRPAPDFSNTLLHHVVWSDPIQGVLGYMKSPRGGTAPSFGKDVVLRFCRNNNLKAILRGHESIQYGVYSIMENHLVTIFSTSYYENRFPNKAGYIEILENLTMRTATLNAYKCPTRDQVSWFDPPLLSLSCLSPQLKKHVVPLPTSPNKRKHESPRRTSISIFPIKEKESRIPLNGSQQAPTMGSQTFPFNQKPPVPTPPNSP